MCLIILAIDQHPDYPVIMLSNRDEFYYRPAAPMHWWTDQDILAGQDIQAGGTWLAIGKNKQMAAVTNYRDLQRNDPNAPSRGQIPVDFVNNATDTPSFITAHREIWSGMNGFNALFYDGQTFYWYSNISDEAVKLTPGIYGISNAQLDTPWPKVLAGKQRLQAAIQNNDLTPELLVAIMADTHPYDEERLPDTGVGLEMERMLSPICIVSPVYGSRVTTIITRNTQGVLNVLEKDILNGSSRTFTF